MEKHIKMFQERTLYFLATLFFQRYADITSEMLQEKKKIYFLKTSFYPRNDHRDMLIKHVK